MNHFRFVSITTYAAICGISRAAVYKRIKSGRAVLLPSSEVPVVDLQKSVLRISRNNWKKERVVSDPF